MKKPAIYLTAVVVVLGIALILTWQHRRHSESDAPFSPSQGEAAPIADTPRDSAGQKTQVAVQDKADPFTDDISKMLDESMPGRFLDTDIKSLDSIMKSARETHVIEDKAIAGRRFYPDVAETIKAKLLNDLGNKCYAPREALAEAEQLGKTFWGQGGLTGEASEQLLYQRRALLELCLEKNPQDEEVYFALYDAITTAWPAYSKTSYATNPKFMVQITEANGSLLRHQKAHCEQIIKSKSPQEITPRDLAVLYDMIHSRQMTNIFFDQAQEEFESRGVKMSPPLSQETQQELRSRINALSLEYTAELLDAAIALSQRSDYEFYRSGFETNKKQFEAGGGMSPWTLFSVANLYSHPPQFWRRTQTFLGTAERRSTLQPNHIARAGERVELNKRASEAATAAGIVENPVR